MQQGGGGHGHGHRHGGVTREDSDYDDDASSHGQGQYYYPEMIEDGENSDDHVGLSGSSAFKTVTTSSDSKISTGSSEISENSALSLGPTQSQNDFTTNFTKFGTGSVTIPGKKKKKAAKTVKFSKSSSRSSESSNEGSDYHSSDGVNSVYDDNEEKTQLLY